MTFRSSAKGHRSLLLCFSSIVIALSFVAFQGCHMLRADQEKIMMGGGVVTLNEVNERIEAFQRRKENKSELAELYAARSVLQVHQDPTFQVTTIVASITFCGPWPDQIGFILSSPITFPIGILYDVVALPVQGVRTLSVEEEQLNRALFDLQQARALGYAMDEYTLGMFVPNATHLDTLGYEPTGSNKKSGGSGK